MRYKLRSKHLDGGGMMLFDLLFDGKKVSNVYFNTRGYVFDSGVPMPSGQKLWLPEMRLSDIRAELASLNREFK